MGMACKYGKCMPATANASSCADCNYSGGTAVQCTVVCPPNTQVTTTCSNPWLALPNTQPCGTIFNGNGNDGPGGCVNEGNQ
jgi:hypothetical protein